MPGITGSEGIKLNEKISTLRQYEFRYARNELLARARNAGSLTAEFFSIEIPSAEDLETKVPLSEAVIEGLQQQGFIPIAKGDVVGLGSVQQLDNDPQLIGDVAYSIAAIRAQEYAQELTNINNSQVVCVAVGKDEFIYCSQNPGIILPEKEILNTGKTFQNNIGERMNCEVSIESISTDERRMYKTGELRMKQEEDIVNPIIQKRILDNYYQRNYGRKFYTGKKPITDFEISINYNSLFDSAIHSELIRQFTDSNGVISEGVVSNLDRIMKSKKDFINNLQTGNIISQIDEPGLLKALNYIDPTRQMGNDALKQRTLRYAKQIFQIDPLTQEENTDLVICTDGPALFIKDNKPQLIIEPSYGERSFASIQLVASVVYDKAKNGEALTRLHVALKKQYPLIKNRLINTAYDVAAANTFIILTTPHYRNEKSAEENKRRKARAKDLGVTLSDDIYDDFNKLLQRLMDNLSQGLEHTYDDLIELHEALYSQRFDADIEP